MSAGFAMPLTAISEQMLEEISIGAGFLGAGGGGNPYIGYLVAKAAIRECGAPRLVQPCDLADDSLVIASAMIGAPTVTAEKCISGEDAIAAVRAVEEIIGRKADAIVSGEIGGLNALLPVMTAARMGLPIVDADGCGRAVPGIDMTAWNASGIATGPVVIVNDHLDRVVIASEDPNRAEFIVRGAVSAMGLSVMSAMYAMSGQELKAHSVLGTMSIVYRIGASIKATSNSAPIERLLAYLRSTPHYNRCGLLASGKIVKVVRETKAAFAIGKIDIREASLDTATLIFQNEYLQLTRGDQCLATVPDVISLVDAETGYPIAAESARFGQRVAVIGTSAPEVLRSERAIKNCGPARFGLTGEYTPIERINNW